MTDIFTAVSAHAALAGVVSVLGAEYRDELASPGRCVWEPTVDTFEPGKRMTGTSTAKEPKSIGTRHAGVRIRVWAEGASNLKTALADIAATEDLVRRLLVAIHETAFGAYQVRTLEWLDADGAELVQQGRACVVFVVFDIPVFKDAATQAPLTVINSSGMEGTLVLPTGDVTSSPSP
jgi:hypothetical protein